MACYFLSLRLCVGTVRLSVVHALSMAALAHGIQRTFDVSFSEHRYLTITCLLSVVLVARVLICWCQLLHSRRLLSRMVADLVGVASEVVFRGDPSDAEWERFEQVLVRVVSLLSAILLSDLESSVSAWPRCQPRVAYEVVDMQGFAPQHLQRLWDTEIQSRSQVVFQWLLGHVIHGEMGFIGGSVHGAPCGAHPHILSRLHRVMEQYHDALGTLRASCSLQIVAVLEICLVLHSLLTSLLLVSTPVSLATLVSCSIVFGTWCLHLLAVELECHAGGAVSFLGLRALQRDLNIRLVELVKPASKWSPQLSDLGAARQTLGRRDLLLLPLVLPGPVEYQRSDTQHDQSSTVVADQSCQCATKRPRHRDSDDVVLVSRKSFGAVERSAVGVGAMETNGMPSVRALPQYPGAAHAPEVSSPGFGDLPEIPDEHPLKECSHPINIMEPSRMFGASLSDVLPKLPYELDEVCCSSPRDAKVNLPGTSHGVRCARGRKVDGGVASVVSLRNAPQDLEKGAMGPLVLSHEVGPPREPVPPFAASARETGEVCVERTSAPEPLLEKELQRKAQGGHGRLDHLQMPEM
eukprot:CAMPEP_0194515716 /NCGR_PEP_ID=MMETSP0253-20130528/48464_1 /TAXON_ID=2966 /ORGANISM="Noctiluca scintillans" /LENGTH=578 /DNA_ID=CAMNT_0039359491 /DNA_START=34 /DNA_END=1768 /DNA_ORIENTATION=-